MLEARGVAKVFGKNSRPVLSDINLTFSPGEATAIVGESGSGKTTLAKILLGLEDPSMGSVSYRGKPLESRGSAWRRQRAELQVIPQHASDALDPRMSIRRHFKEVLQAHRRTIGQADVELMEDRMREVQLDPAYLDAYPRNLSGGQQQRAVIARSLLLEPRVLICDEPTSALDPLTQVEIGRVLRMRCISPDRIFVVITHDLRVARSLSDRVLVMHRGQIVEDGATSEVLSNPSDDYTKQLLAAVRPPGFDDRENSRKGKSE